MKKVDVKMLLSERQFLRVAQRARALTGARLVYIGYDNAYLVFRTASGTTPGVVWEQKLVLEDLAKHIELLRLYRKQSGRDLFKKAHAAMKAHMTLLTTQTINRALQETPIRCGCNCPADLYWGFRYIRWRIGAGIVPEHRRPHIRNPHQIGYVCFRAGSMVLTEQGYRAIEGLKVGDRVYSHRGVLRDVVKTYKSRTYKLLVIDVGKGNMLVCTPEHRIPVIRGKDVMFVSANFLWVGDFIFMPYIVGYVDKYEDNVGEAVINFKSPVKYKVCLKQVRSIEELVDVNEEVYNLEVAEDNTYIVQGVAVSNCKHLFNVLTFYPEIVNVVERLLIKKGLVRDEYVDESL